MLLHENLMRRSERPNVPYVFGPKRPFRYQYKAPDPRSFQTPTHNDAGPGLPAGGWSARLARRGRRQKGRRKRLTRRKQTRK